jgi:hypothetical protein
MIVELSRRHDWNGTERSQDKQILITRHETFRLAGDSRTQDGQIIRIPARIRRKFEGQNDLAMLAKELHRVFDFLGWCAELILRMPGKLLQDVLREDDVVLLG